MVEIVDTRFDFNHDVVALVDVIQFTTVAVISRFTRARTKTFRYVFATLVRHLKHRSSFTKHPTLQFIEMTCIIIIIVDTSYIKRTCFYGLNITPSVNL